MTDQVHERRVPSAPGNAITGVAYGLLIEATVVAAIVLLLQVL